MKLFGLIQRDDYESWIAGQVLSKARPDATRILKRWAGWSHPNDVVAELGGMDLPYVEEMTEGVVRPCVGYFDLIEEELPMKT